MSGKDPSKMNGELKHLYEELFPDELDLQNVECVYDDLTTPADSAAAKTATLPGGCGAASLLRLGGKAETVVRAALFHPGPDELTVVRAGDGAPQCLRLADFRCIQTTEKPEKFPPVTPACQIENIKTTDGGLFQAYVPEEQPLANGIFAFSTSAYTVGSFCHYKYFFFPRLNIAQRVLKRFLGEILLDRGAISEEELKRVLAEHQLRRSKKLGDIIAEQVNLLPSIVEQAIDRIYKENKNLRVGEILLMTGLVDEEQVKRALEIQKNSKKRIGEYLIDENILPEETVYRALAEKFRLEFLDLRQQAFSKKAITALPREAVREGLLLPIRYQGEELLVAVTAPDSPQVLAQLEKHTEFQKVRLALARPSQLNAAINKLFPPDAGE